MPSKDYPNIVVMGLSTTNGGHFASMSFDERVIKTLRAMADEGEAELKAGRKAGKIFIRKRSASSLEAGKSKAPYFLEFVPAKEVQEFEARKPKEGSGWGL